MQQLVNHQVTPIGHSVTLSSQSVNQSENKTVPFDAAKFLIMQNISNTVKDLK